MSEVEDRIHLTLELTLHGLAQAEAFLKALTGNDDDVTLAMEYGAMERLTEKHGYEPSAYESNPWVELPKDQRDLLETVIRHRKNKVGA